MRIIQVYGRFALGGIENHIVGLSSVLTRKQHLCYIVTPRWVRRTPELSASDHYAIDFPHYIPEQAFRLSGTFKLLKGLDADVLHVHGSSAFPLTNALLLMGRRVAKRVVTTPHFNPDSEMIQMSRGRLWRRSVKYAYHFGIRRFLLSRTDAVIALTRGEAEIYGQWRLKEVHRIPLGIDVHAFHLNDGSAFRRQFCLDDRPMVLSVGRLVRYKGFIDLVKAAKIVTMKVPKVMFTIVGEGPDMKVLKALVEECGLSRSVIFTGYLTHKLLRQAYAACDTFVVPSHGEPFGMVVLEAMAAGKPIVATSSGGVAEIVNKSSAILVPKGDFDALATALETILNDKLLASSMGVAAYETAKQSYDWNSIMPKIERIYRG